MQFRVQRKGLDFNKIAEEIGMDVKELKKRTLTKMATDIARSSPVDSGYYARNHEVALRSGSFQSSGIRPNDVPKKSRGEPVNESAAREEGLRFMLEDIQQVDLSSENFVFRNIMAYSGIVEGEHAVYARAARDVGQAIQETARDIRNKR